jgi:hypothetical protein
MRWATYGKVVNNPSNVLQCKFCLLLSLVILHTARHANSIFVITVSSHTDRTSILNMNSIKQIQNSRILVLTANGFAIMKNVGKRLGRLMSRSIVSIACLTCVIAVWKKVQFLIVPYYLLILF